jgi:hypothetical protein
MLTSNYARKRAANIRPFAADPKHHPQLQPDQRLFEYENRYRPAYATFAELRDMSWRVAMGLIREFVKAQTYDDYLEALQVGYVLVWKKLQADPLFCAGKPYKYIAMTAAYAARNALKKQMRYEQRHHLYDDWTDHTEEHEDDDAESIIHEIAFRNQSHQGSRHAAYERYIDARLDLKPLFDQIIDAVALPNRKIGPQPEEVRLLLWAMANQHDPHLWLEQVTDKKRRTWKSTQTRLLAYIKKSGILDDWKPADLHECIEADPKPLQRLAAEFAEDQDSDALFILYQLTTCVKQQDLYDHMSFRHLAAPQYAFLHRKYEIRGRLYATYRIGNPEY